MRIRDSEKTLQTPDVNAKVHGVLVNVAGVGVVITGKAGTGKSEAALKLVTRGHRLIADDVVEIVRTIDGLVGSAPSRLKGILHIRGLGLISVRRMFGENSVDDICAIDMFVQIAETYIDLNNPPDRNETEILGITIPQFIFGGGGDVALRIETAARILADPKSLIATEEIFPEISSVR